MAVCASLFEELKKLQASFEDMQAKLRQQISDAADNEDADFSDLSAGVAALRPKFLELTDHAKRWSAGLTGASKPAKKRKKTEVQSAE